MQFNIDYIGSEYPQMGQGFNTVTVKKFSGGAAEFQRDQIRVIEKNFGSEMKSEMIENTQKFIDSLHIEGRLQIKLVNIPIGGSISGKSHKLIFFFFYIILYKINFPCFLFFLKVNSPRK